MRPPQKLYKYCPFGVFALRAINEAEIFHASPKAFNDPLDCNPTLDLDIDTEEAIRLLVCMLVRRGKTPEDIDQEIQQLRYLATDTGEDASLTPEEEDQQLRGLLGRDILSELQNEMAAHGVLSLSATYASALMWSHYGDQHRGLCLEYDTSLWDVPTLGPVDYRAARAVRAHDILRWKLSGDAEAERKVRHTYFHAKSAEWSYEQEWRDVVPKAGVNTLHFKLTAVHFGLRTDITVRQTIAKALSHDRDVDLYRMWARDDSFELQRSAEDRDYFEQSGIRQPPFLVFGRFVEPPPT